MNRETSVRTTVAFLLGLAAAAFPQTPQTPSNVERLAQIQTSAELPGSVLGPQLIVWSEIQKPQPMPQPLPPGEDPFGRRPSQQQPGQANSQERAAQTFTGTIVKDGDKYVLKVSAGMSYQLDDQDQAKKYEGKQVKIAGDLDTNSSTLHVASIQPVS